MRAIVTVYMFAFCHISQTPIPIASNNSRIMSAAANVTRPDQVEQEQEIDPADDDDHADDHAHGQRPNSAG